MIELLDYQIASMELLSRVIAYLDLLSRWYYDSASLFDQKLDTWKCTNYQLNHSKDPSFCWTGKWSGLNQQLQLKSSMAELLGSPRQIKV